MLRGIHIKTATNKALNNSSWIYDFDSNEIHCIEGKSGHTHYTTFTQLGLVDFDEFDVGELSIND